MFVLHKKTKAHRDNDKEQVNQIINSKEPKSCSIVFQFSTFPSSSGQPRGNKSKLFAFAFCFFVVVFLVCCGKTESHFVAQAILLNSPIFRPQPLFVV